MLNFVAICKGINTTPGTSVLATVANSCCVQICQQLLLVFGWARRAARMPSYYVRMVGHSRSSRSKKLNGCSGHKWISLSIRPGDWTAGYMWYTYIAAASAAAQSPELIWYKIEKTLNKTYTRLKSFLQRFQICSSQNPSCYGMESTS